MSCTGDKREGAHRALDLYRARQFAVARKFAASGWRVLVLSAEHGLIDGGDVIECYERPMTKVRAAELTKATPELSEHRPGLRLRGLEVSRHCSRVGSSPGRFLSGRGRRAQPRQRRPLFCPGRPGALDTSVVANPLVIRGICPNPDRIDRL